MTTIEIKISKYQAKRLWAMGMSYSPSWRHQMADRFRPVDGSDSLEGLEDSPWTFHWCETVTDQVLLSAFFASEGIDSVALLDTVYMATGEGPQFVVLANVKIGGTTDDYWAVSL